MNRNPKTQLALRSASKVSSDKLNERSPDPLTCIFTDITYSTNLWEEYEEIEMWSVLKSHDDLMRKELKHFDGYELKTTGDGIIIVFDNELKKDDPIKALRLCLSVQHTLATEASWLERAPGLVSCYDRIRDPKAMEGQIDYDFLNIRMGLHYGKPFVACPDPTSKRWDYFGRMMNTSARVMNEAQGGQIAVSDAFILALYERQNKRPLKGTLSDPTRKEILSREIYAMNSTEFFEIRPHPEDEGLRKLKGIKERVYITLICWKLKRADQ